MVSEYKIRVVMRRTDGVYVNIKYEPVEDLSRAARFMDMEEYEHFINGYYKPPDKSMYMPQKIRIQYEEVKEDGEHGDL